MTINIALVNRENTLTAEKILTLGQLSYTFFLGKKLWESGSCGGAKHWWFGNRGKRKLELLSTLDYNAKLTELMRYNGAYNSVVGVSGWSDGEEKDIAGVFGGWLGMLGQDVMILLDSGDMLPFHSEALTWDGDSGILEYWKQVWANGDTCSTSK